MAEKPEINPKLLSDLRSDNEALRKEAVAALREMKSREAMELLVEATSDKSPAVRYFARKALKEVREALGIKDEVAAPASEVESREAAEKKEIKKKINIELFKKYLYDPEPKKRLATVKAAAVAQDEDLLEPLKTALSKETDYFVIATMVKTIGQLGGENEIPVLEKYLTHEDDRIRANAIEGLDLTRSQKIIPILVPFIKDPNNRIRANAIKALSRYSKAEMLKNLETMYASPDVWMRDSAVYALAAIGGKEVVPLLKKAAGDSDPGVMKHALVALARMDLPEARAAIDEIRQKAGAVQNSGSQRGAVEESPQKAEVAEKDKISAAEVVRPPAERQGETASEMLDITPVGEDLSGSAEGQDEHEEPREAVELAALVEAMPTITLEAEKQEKPIYEHLEVTLPGTSFRKTTPEESAKKEPAREAGVEQQKSTSRDTQLHETPVDVEKKVLVAAVDSRNKSTGKKYGVIAAVVLIIILAGVFVFFRKNRSVEPGPDLAVSQVAGTETTGKEEEKAPEKQERNAARERRRTRKPSSAAEEGSSVSQHTGASDSTSEINAGTAAVQLATGTVSGSRRRPRGRGAVEEHPSAGVVEEKNIPAETLSVAVPSETPEISIPRARRRPRAQIARETEPVELFTPSMTVEVSQVMSGEAVQSHETGGLTLAETSKKEGTVTETVEVKLAGQEVSVRDTDSISVQGIQMIGDETKDVSVLSGTENISIHRARRRPRRGVSQEEPAVPPQSEDTVPALAVTETISPPTPPVRRPRRPRTTAPVEP